MAITITEVNAAVTLISTAMPQVAAAYTILKSIWLTVNPGSTEADYLAYLVTASQKNLDASAAILTADGYVKDAAGNWSKPATTTPASS